MLRFPALLLTPSALRFCLLLGLLGMALPTRQAVAGDTAEADIVVLKDKDQQVFVLVENETVDRISYRFFSSPGASLIVKRWNEVKSVDYAYLRVEGPYVSGKAEADRGKYDIAAAILGSGFTTAKREPAKIACAFLEGECQEAINNYAGSATAYGRVVSGFPKNRRWLDALYRQGFALALAKDAAVNGVVEQLGEVAKTDGQARPRATAIKAAIAYAAANYDLAETEASKAKFSKGDELEEYLRFVLFRARLADLTKKPSDAERFYGDVVNSVKAETQATLASEARLGLARAQLVTNPDRALILLLSLDAMPLGSANEKVVARYYAGKILWENAQRIEKTANVDDRVRAFGVAQVRDARLLLDAAANSAEASSDLSERLLAKELLATLPATSTPTGAAAPGPANSATAAKSP